MDKKKKKKLTRVVKWFALLEQVAVDMQWHHEAGAPSSLPPSPGAVHQRIPPRCCAVHSLSTPSLHTSHRHQSCFFSICQAAGPAAEVKIYHHLSPHPSWNRRGKKGAEDIHHLFLTGYSGELAHRPSFLPGCSQLLACTRLLSCTSGTTRWRLKLKRSCHSSGQVPGWKGGLDWRNRRSCTRFWAEQQDCSTRTAQGHSSWHIV